MQVYQKTFESGQIKVQGNQKKTVTLSLAVPTELPFKSTDTVPKNEDPSAYFSKHDLAVTQILPPSCRTKYFDISYQGKISVIHWAIGKNKDSEFFALTFRQVR